MFRRSATRVVEHLSDAIDDMLIGDFDYVVDGERLFADIDYERRRLERAAPQAAVARRRPACDGPSRSALARPLLP